MSNTLLFNVLLTWVVFIPLAVINGAVRNMVYQPYVGQLRGHQISTVTGSLTFLCLAYLMLNKHVSNVSNINLFLIGSMWVLMTVIFEFGFGHYVMKNSWDKLLYDYNIFEGRVWMLLLLSVLVIPYLVKILGTL